MKIEELFTFNGMKRSTITNIGGIGHEIVELR